MWVGTNKTIKKKSLQKLYKYYFEINQCKACPKHDQCAKTRARKILRIGLNTNEFYKISQYQKTKEFIEKYKSRASIEGKNASCFIKRIFEKCSSEYCIEDEIKDKNIKLDVTCSMGVSFYPRDGQTVEELMAKSDQILYKVKDKGKADYFIKM